MKYTKFGRRVRGAETVPTRRPAFWGGALILFLAVTACSNSAIDPTTLHVAGLQVESATSMGIHSDSVQPKPSREWSLIYPDSDLTLKMPAQPKTSTHPRRKLRQRPVPQPKVVATGRHLQCVPFAREQSNVRIRGHSWHWWRTARGRYEQSNRPRTKSVLVFKRNGGSRGHLAVVTRIVSKREVIVSHANWLNRGRIHLNTPVRDVSARNDWTRVRVWYTPGSVMGKSQYRTHGFIHPNVLTARRPVGQKRGRRVTR